MRDFAHAPKRQVHDAAPVDLTAGLHRRIPGRGDVAAGYCDQPMIGTIAITLLRGDIDSIDAVESVRRFERPTLCLCRVDPGR